MSDWTSADQDDFLWHSQRKTGGLRVADTLDEIKAFAYKTFDLLDSDNNDFISRAELSNALLSPELDWRERSYVGFLLRRIEDIADSYVEEWETSEVGISRADIQEYFKVIRAKS
ncbi:MAG: hypothetical protein K8F91_02760 [Candidatus Obscuribacterales bacterium]|nr:hypothetical protein [Candidatus Obscuribacterales bacterium]